MNKHKGISKLEIDDPNMEIPAILNAENKKVIRAKQNHGCNLYEKVYQIIDHTIFGSATESTLITDYGIYYKWDELKDGEFISWEVLRKVEFIDNQYHFFLHDNDDPDYSWSSKAFSKSKDSGAHRKNVNHFNKLAESVPNHQLELINELFEEFEFFDYEETELSVVNNLIDLIEKYNERYGNNTSFQPFLDFVLANIYVAKKEYNNAIQELENSSYINEQTEVLVKVLGGHIFTKLGNNIRALNNYLAAKELCPNEDKEGLNEINDRIEECNILMKQEFLAYPYEERKLIIIGNKQYPLEAKVSKAIKFLKETNIPKLQFPQGHPINNELYIGHPYKNNLYIPLANYETEFFSDRINELLYILQCLGAKEIRIKIVSGIIIDQLFEKKSDFSINGETKLAKGNIENKKDVSEINNNYNQNSMTKVQEFDPKEEPYLPNDLIWYHSEPSWQALVKQRLNGYLLKHSENISSEKNEYISINEQKSFAASIEGLQNKIGVDLSRNFKIKSDKKESTEWDIDVDFVPLESLTKLKISNML